jgi:hypothetical protein
MYRELALDPLPFVPRQYEDETLWSWVTRTALYWGLTAEEFLQRLGVFGEVWDQDSQNTDLDCSAPSEFIQRLSHVTGVPREFIERHVVSQSPSTLLLDDRVAFCERCFDDLAVTGSPYVKAAWLDAWCIRCPIHRWPLCTVQEARRALQGGDWNRIWAVKPLWASATLAVQPDSHPGVINHSDAFLWYPPTECLPTDGLNRYQRGPVRVASIGEVAGTGRPQDNFERSLVLLAGQVFSDFSMARAFFSVDQHLAWRNRVSELDGAQSLSEPLGSLAIRSGAIQVGEVLLDILLQRSPRRVRLAHDIRVLVRGLNYSTQWLILDELVDWPPEMCARWADSFGWPGRQALSAARLRARHERGKTRLAHIPVAAYGKVQYARSEGASNEPQRRALSQLGSGPDAALGAGRSLHGSSHAGDLITAIRL